MYYEQLSINAFYRLLHKRKINTIKPSDVDESFRKGYFHHLITVKSIIIERIIHHLRQEKCS